MSQEQLRQSPMMAHLLDALDEGTDIGHYGKLTFAMVGPATFWRTTSWSSC